MFDVNTSMLPTTQQKKKRRILVQDSVSNTFFLTNMADQAVKGIGIHDFVQYL